jgi:3-oxoacyl-[acyl-carrier-protein] synthase II
MKTDAKRVVVTGLGLITSIGAGKDIFWQNLINGKSGISKVESFDTSGHFTHMGGEIKDFDAAEFVGRKKIKLMARASHLAIAAAKLAVKDAGIAPGELKNMRVSVCMGTTGGESQEIEEIDSVWTRQGREQVKDLSIMRYPVNNISANVAIELKLKNSNRMFTTACAAGNYAIGYGFDLLRLGKADLVLAGGSDAFSYLSFTGFNQVGAVAPEKCQPFDKNRKGMLVGEGSAVLVLERLDTALKRGAVIYAEILGYGLSCDAHHMTNPHADGVAHCLRNALQEANITADEVGYISAHGTGTRHNDRTECEAINRVFSGRKVPTSSIKSMLGHTMGAASGIEAITCCLAVKNGMVPPTINFETADPECEIDCVPNKARRLDVNIALNNGFAFGGNNSCLVLKKFKQ